MHRVAVITGGTGGLGRSIVPRLAARTQLVAGQVRELRQELLAHTEDAVTLARRAVGRADGARKQPVAQLVRFARPQGDQLERQVRAVEPAPHGE